MKSYVLQLTFTSKEDAEAARCIIGRYFNDDELISLSNKEKEN